MSGATQTELVAVVSLWRYPVKSMMGEELNATEVSELGLLGDHAYALFDVAMVHVLTTATLDRLRTLYPQGRFEVRRFRPNIVVQLVSDEKGFAENAWVGHTLAIGTAVRLNITSPCGRCVMTTLAQGDLSRDPGILRTAAQHNQVNVGVYAAVVRGGTIRRGDPVRLE